MLYLMTINRMVWLVLLPTPMWNFLNFEAQQNQIYIYLINGTSIFQTISEKTA
jgi:hypothetical protein